MRKLILLYAISFMIFMPPLYSISLADYIQKNGMPEIYYGCLHLSGINLTDLIGLDTIACIDQVGYLDLSNNQLQTLPVTIFNGLHNLRRLSLSQNNLQTLPEGIFDGLHNLVFLSLSYNKLQALPDNIFNSLDSLRFLHLENNLLQALPAGIFDNLLNLAEVYFHNNQLQTLPNTIFNNLQKLWLLYISNNQLQTLPVEIFNGLNNLRSLSLENRSFSIEFLLILPTIIERIAHLERLDGEPVNKALKSYRVYTPKTLAEYLMQNLTVEQCEKFAAVDYVVLDVLPLGQNDKQAVLERIAARHRAQLGLFNSLMSKCLIL